MGLKIRRKKEISSRFSIAWWFCRFLARRRRWCSLSGGRQLKWRHLQREKRSSDNSHRDAVGGGIQQIWVYLCGPAVSARSPLSAGSRCKPCCPRSPTRSTAGDRFSFTRHKHPPHQKATMTATTVLTFPPVTEKLANMQYFSFLWPV